VYCISAAINQAKKNTFKFTDTIDVSIV